MGRLLHAKGLFLTLIFIFVHGTYGYATPILPEVNIDMQAVSRTIDNLHHCVRTHVPSASVSTPSTSITSNPETHARHVATLFRLLSRAAAQHCGVERHLVVSSTQGMGDRFRGIVSAFYLALLTHSGISVEWVLPASIDDFFIVRNFSSNLANITALFDDVNKHELNKSYWKVWAKPKTTIRLMSNAHRWSTIARSPMLRQQASLYGLDGLTQPELFRLAMNVMFPAARPLLLQASHEALASTGMDPEKLMGAGKEAGTYIVGVHMRTGNFDESGHDEGHPRVTMGMAACFADRAIEICQEVEVCVVFLCSDSKQARDLFWQRVSNKASKIHVVSVPGKPIHSVLPGQRMKMFSRRASTLQWRKTRTDWYLLSRADALLLSSSGFGWTAAWTGGVKRIWQVNQNGGCIWTSGSADTCSQTHIHRAFRRNCTAEASLMS